MYGGLCVRESFCGAAATTIPVSWLPMPSAIRYHVLIVRSMARYWPRKWAAAGAHGCLMDGLHVAVCGCVWLCVAVCGCVWWYLRQGMERSGGCWPTSRQPRLRWTEVHSSGRAGVGYTLMTGCAHGLALQVKRQPDPLIWCRIPYRAPHSTPRPPTRRCMCSAKRQVRQSHPATSRRPVRRPRCWRCAAWRLKCTRLDCRSTAQVR